MRPLALAIVAAAVVSAAPGRSEDVGSTLEGEASGVAKRVDRGTALKLGAERGPGVATAAAALPGGTQAKEVAHATLVLPPRLSIGAGRRFGPDAGFELQLGAMLDIPLGPVGSARANTATAHLAAVSADVRRARLDGALAAGVAWSRGLEARDVLKLRATSAAHAKTIHDLAKIRVKSGAGQPVEGALAAAEVGLAGAQTLDAEGSLVDALAELRLAIAVPAGDPIELAGDSCGADEPLVEEKAALAAAKDQNPTLVLARARAASSRTEVKLVSATLTPTLGVGVTFLRGSLGEQVWLGTVSFPLPFADPAGFERARAFGLADVADAEVKRVEVQLEKEVHVAVHDQKHTREVRDKLASDAIVPAREALRLAKIQFESGTEAVTLVLLSRQRLIAIEEQHVHACGEAVRADLRLLRLMGRLP